MKKPIITGDSIEIPSIEDFLPEVDDFIEGKLAAFGLDKSDIADIAISVTELVTNGIVHANKLIPEKTVKVTIAKKNSAIEIVITDQGDGFDPDAIDNPIEDENLLKEVGRGVFIVKSLMDEVVFDSVPGKGTTVTMTKHI
jgi:serine/threonine-protein kinase RsbW